MAILAIDGFGSFWFDKSKIVILSFAKNLQQVRAFENLKREEIYPCVSPARDIVANFCKRQLAILCVFSPYVHLPLFLLNALL